MKPDLSISDCHNRTRTQHRQPNRMSSGFVCALADRRRRHKTSPTPYVTVNPKRNSCNWLLSSLVSQALLCFSSIPLQLLPFTRTYYFVQNAYRRLKRLEPLKIDRKAFTSKFSMANKFVPRASHTHTHTAPTDVASDE